jgi:hypothetical protein
MTIFGLFSSNSFKNAGGYSIDEIEKLISEASKHTIKMGVPSITGKLFRKPC